MSKTPRQNRPRRQNVRHRRLGRLPPPDPEEQLFTGKDLTVFIEQDNSNIRHFLARFRRRTKVVSKSEEMVDLSLRLYHHLHDNLESLIAKISIFRSIFS